MKKITVHEPICAIGNVSGYQNPHYIAYIDFFDDKTRIAKFRCISNRNQGFSAVLPDGIIVPLGNLVLLQEKFAGELKILKIKDFSPVKRWETGQCYQPVLVDSLQFHSYQQICFNRRTSTVWSHCLLPSRYLREGFFIIFLFSVIVYFDFL
jgi:hypothetical protein